MDDRVAASVTAAALPSVPVVTDKLRDVDDATLTFVSTVPPTRNGPTDSVGQERDGGEWVVGARIRSSVVSDKGGS